MCCVVSLTLDSFGSFNDSAGDINAIVTFTLQYYGILYRNRTYGHYYPLAVWSYCTGIIYGEAYFMQVSTTKHLPQLQTDTCIHTLHIVFIAHQ